jgi:hypothetical protein
MRPTHTPHTHTHTYIYEYFHAYWWVRVYVFINICTHNTHSHTAPCNEKRWFVIQLSEDITIESVGRVCVCMCVCVWGYMTVCLWECSISACALHTTQYLPTSIYTTHNTHTHYRHYPQYTPQYTTHTLPTMHTAQVAMTNLEHYSSTFKGFQVLGSEKYPTDSW